MPIFTELPQMKRGRVMALTWRLGCRLATGDLSFASPLEKNMLVQASNVALCGVTNRVDSPDGARRARFRRTDFAIQH